MSSEPITGIVLAGGRSSRMGTDKALLMYKGVSLLENAINVLKPVCDIVIISAPESKYALQGYESWPDILPVNSAMTGIYSCLKRSATPLNIVLSCDMPLMKPEFFTDLLNHVPDADSVVPVHDEDFPEPLCAVYKSNLVHSIEERMISGNYSLYEWIKSTRHFLFRSEQSVHYFPGMFTNINCMEDYGLLKNP